MPANAQPSKKEIQAEAIKSVVDAKRFVFQAQTMSPSGAPIRQLTSGYSVIVLPDSVSSNLPYAGRVYQAPMNSQDGGIKFTSAKFKYTVKERKKGGWDIKIQTEDARNTPQLFLNIYSSGSATLRVSSSDRQSISYNGVIEEITKK